MLTIALFSTCLARTLWQTPSNATVSFAPKYYTYEQIAAKLTTPDRHIVCAAKVRSRAALIALSARSSEQATSLLCQGLDLSLEKSDGEKEFVLAESEPVAIQQKRWRIQLSRFFHDSLVKDIDSLNDSVRVYGSVPPEELSQELNSYTSQLSRASDESERRDLQAKIDAISLATRYTTNPEVRLSVAAYRLGGVQLGQGISSPDQTWKSYPISALPAKLVAEEAAMAGSGLPDKYERVFIGEPLERIPYSIALRPQLMLVGPREFGIAHLPARVLRASGQQTLPSLVFTGDVSLGWKGLDQEGKAAYKASQVDTLQVLADEKPVALTKMARSPDSAPEFLLNWSKSSGRDIICEILPPADALPNSDSGTIDGLRGLFTALPSLGLKKRDGCLIVTDRLAFVDRALPFPVAELAELATTSNSRVASSLPQAAVLRFLRAAADPRMAVWWNVHDLQRTTYLGVPTDDLMTGALAFLAWAEFSSSSRVPSPGQPLRLSLANLPPSAIERLGTAAVKYATNYHGWLPEFQETLRRSDVVVEVAPGSENSQLTVRLVPSNVDTAEAQSYIAFTFKRDMDR